MNLYIRKYSFIFLIFSTVRCRESNGSIYLHKFDSRITIANKTANGQRFFIGILNGNSTSFNIRTPSHNGFSNGKRTRVDEGNTITNGITNDNKTANSNENEHGNIAEGITNSNWVINRIVLSEEITESKEIAYNNRTLTSQRTANGNVTANGNRTVTERTLNSNAIANGDEIAYGNRSVINEGIANSYKITNANSAVFGVGITNNNGTANGKMTANGNRTVTVERTTNSKVTANGNLIAEDRGIENHIRTVIGERLDSSVTSDKSYNNNYLDIVTIVPTLNKNASTHKSTYKTVGSAEIHVNKELMQPTHDKAKRVKKPRANTMQTLKGFKMAGDIQGLKVVTEPYLHQHFKDRQWRFERLASNPAPTESTLSSATSNKTEKDINKMAGERRQYVPPGPGPPSREEILARFQNISTTTLQPETVPTDIYIPGVKNVADFQRETQQPERYNQPYYPSGHWVFNRTTRFYTLGPSKLYTVLPWNWQVTGTSTHNPNVPFVPTGNYMNYHRECDLNCLVIYRNVFMVVCGIRQNTMNWEYQYKTFNNVCELEFENCRDKHRMWRLAFRGPCEVYVPEKHENNEDNIVKRKREWVKRTFPTRNTALGLSTATK